MTTKQLLERIAVALEGQRVREVMNTQEAADFLGVSRSFLDELKSTVVGSRYLIQFGRIGGRVVFRRKDLEKYLDQVTVSGPSDDPGRIGHGR